jgi:DNA (cytosine-5)-methyltransferase 1
MKNNSLKVGSLFTGIGGFDIGFERAGMTCKWQCEIDHNCQTLLQNRFGVKIYADVKTISTGVERVDVLCGGFPCQDLSLAGTREGLKGERSGLWFEFARIIGELKPKWVVIENVAGLLSSQKGQDFAIILQTLDEFGYGVGWRIFDSQYFGVAQRRRRVLIVASLGNRCCTEVLFEPESVSRHFTESKGKGQSPSRATQNRNRKGGRTIAYNIHQNDDGRKDRLNGGLYITETDKSLTLSASASQGKSHTWIAYENHPNDSRITKTGEISQQLTARMGTGGNNVPLVQKYWDGSDISDTLDVSSLVKGQMMPHKRRFPVVFSSGVRRLTPTECERLQGFPDNWTEGFSDTARYKMLGNAVTVNVAEWIGKRIVTVDKGIQDNDISR